MRQLIIRFLEFILARAKAHLAAPPAEPADAGETAGVVEVYSLPDAAGPDAPSVEASRPLSPPMTSRRGFASSAKRGKTRWFPAWLDPSLIAAGAAPPLELYMEAHQPPPGADPIDWSLERAKLRLTKTEVLLLEPDPDSIQQATFQVDEVVALITRVERGFENDRDPARRALYVPNMLDLYQQLKRVRRLLEGAKRMQWARIRWIGSIVQTYTSTGGTRLWNPAARTWTCEM